MTVIMPENVSYIISTLHKEGFEAYAVGGCVRDSLLGRSPEDWDITTSAAPDQVKAIFKRTVDTGIAHGTVTIMLDKDGYEVTTYRVDGKYSDGRHPESVSFTKSLSEDLKRRDFTINAMAYNDEEGLIDLFGGQADLEARIIRCVGEPHLRFGEDALRILRAVRFSAQLDFSIEETTLAAASELASTLKKISAERIRVELDKLICSKHPERLMTAYEAGITAVVLPEFDACVKETPPSPAHIYNVAMHSIEAIRALDRHEHFMCWALLLHDIGKPVVGVTMRGERAKYIDHAHVSAQMASKVMKRLKFDNFQLNMVKKLIYHHDDALYNLTDAQMRRKMNEIGPEYMDYIISFRRADNSAKAPERLAEVMDRIDCVNRQIHTILERGDCVLQRDLAITGNDLISLGFEPGKRMGEVLAALLDRVLEDPSLNKREVLQRLAAEIL